mmetsp:Transcript_20008/g.22265  ORF Transcript_20008/g.22265 Transcript_20008/m.22265 type:complete len:101 (+) Transcript_20008:161-463(+)
MEYCTAGSVKDVMDRCGSCLNEAQISRILFSVVNALVYMHNQNVCHMNIRAREILLDNRCTPKLAFPYRKPSNPRRNEIGEPYWYAPERVLCTFDGDVQT